MIGRSMRNGLKSIEKHSRIEVADVGRQDPNKTLQIGFF